MSNNNDKYSYKYDKLSNITDIIHNNKLENKYYYNEHNELIKEDNYLTNETIKYIYDNVGNILNKRIYELKTNNLLNDNKYEYNNNTWEDLLTKYNDEVITYDNIGNPVSIGNKTLNWINGRELNSYSDLTNTIIYKYNKDGIRTYKKINENETYYYVNGNEIIFEKINNNVIYYIRDENSNLIGFIYNDNYYYYLKNVQEDIIGILDSNYNKIVEYKYDSYGNITYITDNEIARINPYRYRSYYYDTETNLYYLNSRYYNPLWGRFINADGIISANNDIISGNLFAYVSNNPVNNSDNGEFAIGASVFGGAGVKTIIAAGIALITGAYYATRELMEVAVDYASNYKPRKKEKKKSCNRDEIYAVYTLTNINTFPPKVEYVGRTKNISTRKQQHKSNPNRGHLIFGKVRSGLSYEEARGLEQSLILKYNTLNRGIMPYNQINGVRWDNPRCKEYMLAAEKFLNGETYVGWCK